MVQILSVVYNGCLIGIAAWWLRDLKHAHRIETIAGYCTIFVIICHSVIMLKLLNPAILPGIKATTAIALNFMTLSYWGGIFVPQVLRWQQHRQQRLKIHALVRG